MSAVLRLPTNPRTVLLTRRGTALLLQKPEQTEVQILDVVAALSGQLLDHGHVDVAVLQHVAFATRLAQVLKWPDPFPGLVAAHLAHQAFVGDVDPMLQADVPGLNDLVERWRAHVHLSWGLEYPLSYGHLVGVVAIHRLARCVALSATGHPGLSLALKDSRLELRDVKALQTQAFGVYGLGTRKHAVMLEAAVSDARGEWPGLRFEHLVDQARVVFHGLLQAAKADVDTLGSWPHRRQ